jgi:hypothetical protein
MTSADEPTSLHLYAQQHELTTIERLSARNQDTEWRILQTGSKGAHCKTKKNRRFKQAKHQVPPLPSTSQSQ